MENRAFTHDENGRNNGEKLARRPSPSGGDAVNLKKSVGLFESMALVVGTQIGSGIFVSPGGIQENSGNVWLSLIIMALSGVLSTFAAIVYIELSTVVPTSGGEYPYILAAFGSVPGFLNAWAGLTLLRPAQLTLLCLTCAVNIVEPFAEVKATNHPEIMSGVRLICAAIIIVITCINCSSVKFAAQVQIAFTVGKLIGIAVIIGAGIYNLAQGKTEYFPTGFQGSNLNFGKIASAFFSGLWAYDGWNQLNCVAEEIEDPYRSLPRAILIGIPLVTLCNIFVNISFLTVIKPADFAKGSTVINFGREVLGFMSFLMPLSVVLSTFGAGNGVLFTSARVTYVAAREGHLPDCISYVDIKRNTPSISLVINAAISIIMVFAFDVKELIDFFSYGAWIFYGVTASTLIVLRYKMPSAPRPLKAPAWMAVVIILMSGFLTVSTVVMSPRWEYLYSVLFILSGIFLYIPFVKFQLVLPGIDPFTKFVQLIFLAVPPEAVDDGVIIGELGKAKARKGKRT